MKLLRALYSVVIDALFPMSPVEAALARMSPEEAWQILPAAPSYDASVVPLPHSRSLLAYKDERVSKLVWCIKYKKNAHAVELGGYVLWKALGELRDADTLYILLPTPITPQRRRERGYNQCELILDEIQRLDMQRKFIYEKNLLVRTIHKNRQTLKGRAERLESAVGIFTVDPAVQKDFTQKYAIHIGKKIVLIVIDDVITTGSTLKSALDALTDAGFTDVRGLSIAH